MVNNIKNNTISEISAKKSLNTLNEIKNAGIIKYKNHTPGQKELLWKWRWWWNNESKRNNRRIKCYFRWNNWQIKIIWKTNKIVLKSKRSKKGITVIKILVIKSWTLNTLK